MRIVVFVVLGAAAAASANAQAAPAAALNLACDGQAAYTKPNLDQDEHGDFKDDKVIHTQGRVKLRVEGDVVRIKLPSTLPGGDAWRDADQVVVNADQISGRVKFGLIGRVRFEVNRHTGDIDLKGDVRFTGACEKAADDSAPAKF